MCQRRQQPEKRAVNLSILINTYSVISVSYHGIDIFLSNNMKLHMNMNDVIR